MLTSYFLFENRHDLDRILDKVSQKGVENLSDYERFFLQNYEDSLTYNPPSQDEYYYEALKLKITNKDEMKGVYFLQGRVKYAKDIFVGEIAYYLETGEITWRFTSLEGYELKQVLNKDYRYHFQEMVTQAIANLILKN